MSTANIIRTLLPTVAIVFAGFLVIGLAMPVLPLHVHHGLGLGMLVVGLVAGAQFAASLVARFPAGRQADSRGAKRAVLTGLALAAAAGVLYALSLPLAHVPAASVTVLLIGRAVLGAGESFIVAGALVWGLALVGGENAGMVMAWVGTPMYVAYALGAPIGTLLYARFGFSAIALATMLIPLATLFGAYTACLDVALGFGNSVLGLVAGAWGLSSVFGVSTIVVACAAAVALPMLCAAVVIKNVSRTGAYSGN